VQAWGAFGSKVLGGWSVSGVTVAQTGQPMTITGTNSFNVFGISEDRAQLAPGCTNSQLGTSGSVKSRLNNYFNTNCVNRVDPSQPFNAITNPYAWPVISSDGGTAFGNMGVGIIDGPGQFNFDMSAIKHTKVHWPSEVSDVEFRAEFFNAFNHPQFANPDTNTSESTFGQILGTAVSPRVLQFALKFSF